VIPHLSDKMGATEKFCLKWNDFESNISHSFREIREDKDFFDITLACDDENQVSAHKVILSACSPFFRSVLRRHKHEHPLLYLKGIKHSDLTAVLNFMYHGEVNVAQDDLNTFLAVAEDLKVKGLTQQKKTSDTEEKGDSTVAGSQPSSRTVSPPAKHTPKIKSRDSSSVDRPSFESSQPPSKKQRVNQGHEVTAPQYINDDSDGDEIQEIVPVKAELAASNEASQQQQQQSVVPITPSTPSIATQNMMGREQYSEREQGFASEFDDYSEAGYEDDGAYDASMMDANTANIDTNKDVEEYMQCLTENGVESWQCLICYKIDKRRGRLKDHINSIHLGKEEHCCFICVKKYRTKNSLQNHLSVYHKHDHLPLNY